MFEPEFRAQLKAIKITENAVEDLWQEIRVHYTGSGRFYHHLSHLDHLVSELLPLKDNLSSWQTIVFSIAYHDMVYDPLRTDNEEKSAARASERLAALPVTASCRNNCVAQILATKRHLASPDADTNYFTDADLAILGAPAEDYTRYTAAIRLEYSCYPNLVYMPGRRKVLQHFLQLPGIYKTRYFHDKYEQRARANIQKELDSLCS